MSPEDMNEVELAAELVAQQQRNRLGREYAQQLENLLGERMTGKRLEVQGLGVFERNRRSSRKSWAHDDVWSEMRKAAVGQSVDQETGEAVSRTQAIELALTIARSVVTQSGYKVGGLRSIGCDPDEFAETTYEPGYSIRVTTS